MLNEKESFKPLSLHPHWMQFVIQNFHWMVLLILSCMGYAITEFPFDRMFPLTGFILILLMLYRFIYLYRMEWIITADQLIFLHGVIKHSTDYMELYRVVDYQQQRTLMQQLLGMKTVIIYSGDRNTPVMFLIGIKNSTDVVSEIRRRVEYNKAVKHIYEITNKP